MISVLESAQKTEKLNSENPLAYNGLATFHLFSSYHATVRDFAKTAIKFNPSYAPSYWRLSIANANYGGFWEAEKNGLKTLVLSTLIKKYQIFFIGIYLSFLGQGRYEEALESINRALQIKEYGSTLGFRASLLGHLEKGSEAKMELDTYLALRPNLKTLEDYRNSFITNSVLADTIIKGLIKASWKP